MKRWISLLLVVATLCSMCSGLAGCTKKEPTISRGEWISMLADRFGMDSTITENPYFTDVDKENPYYVQVQSCADWHVLSNEKDSKFQPNQDATVEFALETAILASEVDTKGQSFVDYALANNIIKDKGFMSTRGRLSTETAAEILTWTQNLYLNGLIEPHANVEYAENVQNLTTVSGISPAVKEEQTEEGTVESTDRSEYTVPAEVAQSLQSGDVVIMPDEEFEDGYGVKVDEIIMNEDGTATILTLEPEIEEVLKDLDFAGSVSCTMADIQLGDGFSFAGVGGVAYEDCGEENVYVSNLVNYTEDELTATNLSNGAIPDISLKANFTKGTVTLNPQWDSLFGLGESFSTSATSSAYATDPERANGLKPGQLFKDKETTTILPTAKAFQNTEYKNQLAIDAYHRGELTMEELKKELNVTENQEEKNPTTITNKFTGGYEITGELKVSNIRIDASGKYSIFSGLKASMTVGYTVSSTLKIKGTLSEQLNFATIRVPIATGITVDVKFYLCLDANGELSVTAKVENTTKYSIENLSVKKSSDSSSSLTATISCQIDFGPKISAELCVAGIPLMDVGVKAVARAKATASISRRTSYTSEIDNQGNEKLEVTRETAWKRSVIGYFPIISLEVNGNPKSIGNKLKLNASWVLLGESKAPHYDLLPEEETIIWSETIVLEDKHAEEETEPTDATEADTNVSYGDFLDIDNYFLDINENSQAAIGVTVIPQGYKISDLIWTSSDTRVVTVSGGTVNAVGGGIATITVRTPDGKFYKQCGVSVTASENTFTPLDDNMGKMAA